MTINQYPEIYFVCTGNTCRSPMAENDMDRELQRRGITGITVKSRRAAIKAPISSKYVSNYSSGKKGVSEGTAAVLLNAHGDNEEFAEELSGHQPRDFTPDELADASLVITMGKQHQNILLRHPLSFTPDKLQKVFTFGEVVGQPDTEIADPFNSDQSLIEETYVTEKWPDDQEKLDRLHYRKSPALKLSDKEITEFLGNDRITQLRLEAYGPTYEQIHSMVQALIKNPQVPTIDMFTSFTNWARSSHQGWQKQPEKKSYGKTPRELYEQADYHGALKKVQEITVSAIDELVRLQSTYDYTAEFVPDLKSVADEYAQILHDTVVPGLLFDIPLTPDWTLDVSCIGAGFEGVFARTGEAIPDMVRDLPRDEAFAAYTLARGMAEAAETLCPSEITNKVYQGIRGVTE